MSLSQKFESNGKMISLLSLSILVFFISSAPMTVFAASVTFSASINLSNDAGMATQPAVANNGQNVYVTWTEGSRGIFFRMSSDGGATWTPPTSSPALKLSINGGVSQFPVMFTEYQATNVNDVYVAWSQTILQANGSRVLQVFVASSTNNGLSFTRTQLSHNSTKIQITPAIAANGKAAYVTWFSSGGGRYTSPGSIYVSSTTNNGATWSGPVDVINPSVAGEPQIVASGSNAYVIAAGIDFTASYNSGASWSPALVLFANPNPTGVNYGREPWIAAYGQRVYATWNANSTLAGVGYQALGRTSVDGGKTWGPLQTLSQTVRNDWEPENAAYGTNAFLTFHSIGNQGI